MNTIAAHTNAFSTDIARRILVQRAPLARGHERVAQVMKDMAGQVKTLAEGIDFTADDAREALAAQSVMAAGDIYAIAGLVPPERRANAQLVAQQTLARAMQTARNHEADSPVMAAVSELPEELAESVVMGDDLEESPRAQRPSGG